MNFADQPQFGDRIVNPDGTIHEKHMLFLKEIVRVLEILELASYEVATVPSAAEHTPALIYVSDEAGGATIAFSDGTNWRRTSDRAIIS